MILLVSPPDVYITGRLIEEAKSSGRPLELLTMDQLAARRFKLNIDKYQVLFARFPYVRGSARYFPEMIALAKEFQAAGKKVVDAALAAGEVGQGKLHDYEKLAAVGLPIPATGLLADPLLASRFPFIVKWIFGFKSRGTFLIRGKNDLKKIPADIPKQELLRQEFIPADYEYKVITVGYRALPVVLRFAINKTTWRPDFRNYDIVCDFGILNASEKYRRSNFIDSGPVRQKGIGSDEKLWRVIELAEQSSRRLGRELAKVDILQQGNKLYILEVNRWPGLKSFEKLTGYNAVAKFLKYLGK